MACVYNFLQGPEFFLCLKSWKKSFNTITNRCNYILAAKIAIKLKLIIKPIAIGLALRKVVSSHLQRLNSFMLNSSTWICNKRGCEEIIDSVHTFVMLSEIRDKTLHKVNFANAFYSTEKDSLLFYYIKSYFSLISIPILKFSVPSFNLLLWQNNFIRNWCLPK